MMDMTACLRRACLALASTALVVGLTGCTGSNEPDPLPPVDTASPAVGSPSETARPDEVGPGTEAWRQRLEPDESAAYDNALIRWSEYTRRAEDVYARGKNTARARQFFRDMDLRWRERIRVLEGIERAGLKEIRTAQPLRTRAGEIRLQPDGTGLVVINQCTDYTNIRYERNGKVERGLKPENLVAPLIVAMRKQSPEVDWKVADIELRGSKSCAD